LGGGVGALSKAVGEFPTLGCAGLAIEGREGTPATPAGKGGVIGGEA